MKKAKMLNQVKSRLRIENKLYAISKAEISLLYRKTNRISLTIDCWFCLICQNLFSDNIKKIYML